MIILSSDDHTIEPPNVFDGRLASRYQNRAPKLMQDAEGHDHWVFEGKDVATVGLNATASWPPQEWGMNPSSFAEMRPGAYLVDERVRDMDRNGVLASMCFPSMPGFSGGRLYDATDKELALAVLQAYNDWHVDEWCGSHPGRFIPLIIGPGWDPEAMVTEIHRMAAKGARAISLPELPHLLGLPSYRSDYWFPVWTALSEENVVACLHIGQGLDALDMGPEFPIDNYMVLATQVSVLCTQDLIWGPAMRTFPDLKFAFSEGGIGWLPFLLDRLDRHYAHQRWTGQDFGGEQPSEVFREHSLACFISDPTTLKLYREIGLDMIAYEVDFPHSDSTWPDAPEELLRECQGAGMSDEDIDQLTWKNVARFFNYDPFAHITREQATVGALRANATDVETAIVPRAEWRRRYEANPRFEVASV